jgi:hypothetical protein
MVQNKNYKRQTRQLSDATKQKISQKLKGRMKSPTTCARISSSMKEYWKTVESNTDTGENI